VSVLLPVRSYASPPLLNKHGAFMSQSTPALEEELTREIVRVLRMGSAFQAALHGLHEKLELPAVLEQQERLRLAAAYDGTATTLRARAARHPDGSQERAELQLRAATFENRARVKRSGERMPHELRTPRERLEAVAVLRDGLVQLLELATDVRADDLEFFEAALLDESKLRPPAAGSPGEQLDLAQSILRGVLNRLGALVDPTGSVHLLPFGLPAAETPHGVVTSLTPGTPGPQPRAVISPGAAASPPGAPANGAQSDAVDHGRS
jgi:hypothetical protein